MWRLIKFFFIWCAGSDINILRECPHGEEIKHFGFGVLVCIPPILGLISMTYAISTFIHNEKLYYSCGIIWALIIFFYDRFAISTFKKSVDTSNPIKKDSKSAIFIVRLVLSLIASVAVAHPITLLFFEDSITKKLEVMKRAECTKIFNDYEKKRIGPLDSMLAELQKRVGKKTNDIDSLHYDLDAEIRGIDRTTNVDGLMPHANRRFTYTVGNGPHAQAFREHIQYIETERDLIRKANTQDSFEIRKRIIAFEKERDTIIAHEKPNTDYLAQYDAFTVIGHEKPHVYVCFWFIFIFFIVVDVVPIVYKVFTQAGPYDHMKNEVDNLFNKRKSVHYAALIKGLDNIEQDLSVAVEKIRATLVAEYVDNIKTSLRQTTQQSTPGGLSSRGSIKSKAPAAVAVSPSYESKFILVVSIVILSGLIMFFCAYQDWLKYLGLGSFISLVYTILKDNLKYFAKP